jgi:hypothetical protein
MDDIILNFEHILKIFWSLSHCITLGAGWTNIWTWKMEVKVTLSWANEKKTKFVYWSRPSVGKFILIIGTIFHPWFWSAVFQNGHLVTMSKELSSKILLELFYEQILRLTLFFAHNWLWYPQMTHIQLLGRPFLVLSIGFVALMPLLLSNNGL